MWPKKHRVSDLASEESEFHEVGEEVSQDLVVGSTQTREELSVVEEVGSQSLGEREHALPAGNVIEKLLVKPVAPEKEPLGVAGGAEVPALAANGNEELGVALIAAHSSPIPRRYFAARKQVPSRSFSLKQMPSPLTCLQT